MIIVTVDVVVDVAIQQLLSEEETETMMDADAVAKEKNAMKDAEEIVTVIATVTVIN